MYKPNPGYVEGNMVHGQRTLIGCLLGIIVLSAGAALFLQGNQFSSLPQLPITAIGIIILGGLGLYFLIRGNLGAAVTIVSVLFVAAAVGPLVILGLDAGEGMLPLLFVPLALSVLALTRTQLLLTAL